MCRIRRSIRRQQVAARDRPRDPRRAVHRAGASDPTRACRTTVSASGRNVRPDGNRFVVARLEDAVVCSRESTRATHSMEPRLGRAGIFHPPRSGARHCRSPLCTRPSICAHRQPIFGTACVQYTDLPRLCHSDHPFGEVTNIDDANTPIRPARARARRRRSQHVLTQ